MFGLLWFSDGLLWFSVEIEDLLLLGRSLFKHLFLNSY